MTDLLLDTNVFAWVLTKPGRLPAAVIDALEDPTNRLIVSAVTAWEISTKVRLGRWSDAEPLVSQFQDLATHIGAVELPITTRHALRAGELHWPHRDPFDRVLAAQALLDNMTLVTSDAAFSTLGGLRVLW